MDCPPFWNVINILKVYVPFHIWFFSDCPELVIAVERFNGSVTSKAKTEPWWRTSFWHTSQTGGKIRNFVSLCIGNLLILFFYSSIFMLRTNLLYPFGCINVIGWTGCPFFYFLSSFFILSSLGIFILSFCLCWPSIA